MYFYFTHINKKELIFYRAEKVKHLVVVVHQGSPDGGQGGPGGPGGPGGEGGQGDPGGPGCGQASRFKHLGVVVHIRHVSWKVVQDVFAKLEANSTKRLS